MKIALQMKSPYFNEQDMVSSIDAQSYMYKFGFFGGVDAAWKDYVRQSYEDFDASFAANEGIEPRSNKPSCIGFQVIKESDSDT